MTRIEIIKRERKNLLKILNNYKSNLKYKNEIKQLEDKINSLDLIIRSVKNK